MSNILIVEDEPIIAEDLATLLQKEGHSIVGIANTGEEALDMLANRSPKMVLLDIALNTSMSGLEVAEIINEKYHIPFIFITSFSDNYTLDRVRNLFPEVMQTYPQAGLIDVL